MEDKARKSISEETNEENRNPSDGNIDINAMVKDIGKLYWKTTKGIDRYIMVGDLSWKALKFGTRVVAQSTFTPGNKYKLKLLHEINDSLESIERNRDIDSRIETWNEINTRYYRLDGIDLERALAALDLLKEYKGKLNMFSEAIEPLKSFKYRLGQVAATRAIRMGGEAAIDSNWRESVLKSIRDGIKDIRKDFNKLDSWAKSLSEEMDDWEAELKVEYYDTPTEEIEEEEFYDTPTDEKYYDARQKNSIYTKIKNAFKWIDSQDGNVIEWANSPVGNAFELTPLEKLIELVSKPDEDDIELAGSPYKNLIESAGSPDENHIEWLSPQDEDDIESASSLDEDDIELDSSQDEDDIESASSLDEDESASSLDEDELASLLDYIPEASKTPFFIPKALGLPFHIPIPEDNSSDTTNSFENDPYLPNSFNVITSQPCFDEPKSRWEASDTEDDIKGQEKVFKKDNPPKKIEIMDHLDEIEKNIEQPAFFPNKNSDTKRDMNSMNRDSLENNPYHSNSLKY